MVFNLEDSIFEYLDIYDGSSAVPTFRGSIAFEYLRYQGLILPGHTYIRLMWNLGRGDEFFNITLRYELLGADYVPAHTARSGVFTPEEVLDQILDGFDEPPYFEMHSFNLCVLEERVLKPWPRQYELF